MAVQGTPVKSQPHDPIRFEGRAVVRSQGGSMGTRIAGTCALLIGMGIVWAAVQGSGDLADNPWPGYLMGAAWIIAGVGIIGFRAETRFDLERRVWHTGWTIWGVLGQNREGVLSALAKVELLREKRSSDEGGDYYVYVVRVGVRDAPPVWMFEGRSALDAFRIADRLSKALRVRLEDRSTEPDASELVFVEPPRTAATPQTRMTSYTIDGDRVTFVIPPGTKGEAVGCMGMLLALAAGAAAAIWWFIVAPAENPWAVGAVVFLFLGIPFVLLPAYGALVILAKAFFIRETLTVWRDGVIHRRAAGPWVREKRFSRAEIVCVKVAMDSSKRARSVLLRTRDSQIMLARGLPEEEKLWLASVLKQALGLPPDSEDAAVAASSCAES